MQNFPQSFEPVSSDSILEEFLQLKRNVNEVNDGMVQVETDLANEVNDRQLADQNLQSQIDEIAGHQGTSVKVAGVVQEEVSFVSDPQTQINSKQNTISDLETIRTGASLGSTAVQPSQLTSAINGEASTRQLADQNLQSQIDEIIGSSGTTVKVAGVAQTEVSFTSDPQTQINGKQGTISDLATIRNGASLGATAVQPGTLASELANKQDLISASNPLSADLVDDASTTNKFVRQSDINTWNSKQDAISDLATIRSGASLGATAVQPATLTSELATKQNKLSATFLWGGNPTSLQAFTIDLSQYLYLIIAFKSTDGYWLIGQWDTAQLISEKDYDESIHLSDYNCTLSIHINSATVIQINYLNKSAYLKIWGVKKT